MKEAVVKPKEAGGEGTEAAPSDSQDFPRPLQQLHGEVVRKLRAVGNPTPELDARLLITRAIADVEGHTLSHAAYILAADRLIAPNTQHRIAALLARRVAGEPVARILGSREFYGRDFEISGAVLDPRPETETLIECVLHYVRAAEIEAPRILDLGTGSGAILLTLLAELPQATGLGTDISEQALAVAQKNARRLGLDGRATFQIANWASGIEERFDVIVSNPPYIPSGVIDSLTPEVRNHDPWLALDGGSDGLAAYRQLLPQLGRCLKATGMIALEVGAGQAHDVAALIKAFDREQQFKISFHQDLAQIERCVVALKCDVFSHHFDILMKP